MPSIRAAAGGSAALWRNARAPAADRDAGAGAAAQAPWFRELNLDPRTASSPALGTRVVQIDQEDLMPSAWNQVIGIEAANRALA